MMLWWNGSGPWVISHQEVCFRQQHGRPDSTRGLLYRDVLLSAQHGTASWHNGPVMWSTAWIASLEYGLVSFQLKNLFLVHTGAWTAFHCAVAKISPHIADCVCSFVAYTQTMSASVQSMLKVRYRVCSLLSSV